MLVKTAKKVTILVRFPLGLAVVSGILCGNLMKTPRQESTPIMKKEIMNICVFMDFLKEKGIVSLAMFDDDAYLKLKRDIEDFVNEDYNLNPYIYERIKRVWKNKYGERWE